MHNNKNEIHSSRNDCTVTFVCYTQIRKIKFIGNLFSILSSKALVNQIAFFYNI